MAIGTSIFLIAAGAVLTWAIEAEVEGVNLDAVGVILMVVGVIGLLFSLIWAATHSHREPGVVVEERHHHVP